MLILMGKTASGKNLVRDRLVNKYHFSPIITYTTRPMRKNEKQDVTYHFISTDEFLEKINNGFFAEWKDYVTNDGIWYYGTALEDCVNATDNDVIILTPDGVRDLKKNGVNAIVIYLYSNLNTIKHRLKFRGDDLKEVERRISSDIKDFKDAEMLADRIVYNVGRLKTIKKRFIINDGRIINLVDQEGYIGEEEEDEKYFSNLW